jgi:hypothetical protein
MAADQEREFCRQAATLIRDARAGSLATVAGGAPYAALVTPAVADDAHLILLLSTLSAHTRHLMANPACALLLVGEPAETNPQTAPRVSLSCLAAVSDQAAARQDRPTVPPIWPTTRMRRFMPTSPISTSGAWPPRRRTMSAASQPPALWMLVHCSMKLGKRPRRKTVDRQTAGAYDRSSHQIVFD